MDAGPATLAALMAELGSPSARGRRLAALRLRDDPPAGAADAIPLLAELLLHDKNGPVREAARQALAAVDSEAAAAPIMTAALADTAAEVRLRACAELERMGDKASAAAATVIARAFEDADEGVRAAAVAALGTVDVAGSTLPFLHDALRASSNETRRQGVACAAVLGVRAAGAVDDLCVVLRDPDEETRRGAVLALMRMGPPAAAAIPALEEALQDDTVELFARMALDRIRTPEA